MRYAQYTSVNPEKSRGDIERTLKRYNASGFAYGWEGAQAVVQFVMNNKHIRFVLPLPSSKDFEVTKTGRKRKREAAQRTADFASRQCWRALLLSIKAKLETVESGIATFEIEFMPYIVLPSGKTIGQVIGPQIDQAYKTGKMTPLLPENV